VRPAPKSAAQLFRGRPGLSRWRETRPHLEAFLLGCAATALSLGIMFMLLRGMPWEWWQYKFWWDTVRGLDRVEEQMAFAQVFTGFAGILMTVGLGTFGIREFIKNIKEPQLDVFFGVTRPIPMGSPPADPNDGLVKSITVYRDFNRDDRGPYVFNLEMANSGSIAADYFTLDVKLPFLDPWTRDLQEGVYHLVSQYGLQKRFLFTKSSVLRSIRESWNRVDRSEPIRIRSGTFLENWRVGQDRDRSYVLTFASNGTVSVFPQTPMRLCQFVLPFSRVGAFRTGVECPYRISSRYAKPDYGCLVVNFSPDEEPTTSSEARP
jgi:hypothetical protein